MWVLDHRGPRHSGQIIRELLVRGCDVNVRTSKGTTALMVAASRGLEDVCKVGFHGRHQR